MVHAHNNDGSSQIGFSGVTVSTTRPTAGQILTAIDDENAHWATGGAGEKGDKGDKGDTGTQGIQGIQGVKGDTGTTGSQGIQGVKGDKGDTGAAGGGSAAICTNINGDLTIVDGYDILIVDCSAPRNITLPNPVNGRTIVIKDATGQAGTNPITLIRYASEYIEGIAASKLLNANWGAWKIVADTNGNWFIIA